MEIFQHVDKVTLSSAILLGFLAWFVVRNVIGGFFTVNQNERAVLTTFGRAQRVLGATSTFAEETVSSGQRNGNIAHAWVFPVSAGVNSFDVRLYRHAAGDGALVGWFAELAAIYSPFGPTGHGPVRVEPGMPAGRSAMRMRTVWGAAAGSRPPAGSLAGCVLGVRAAAHRSS